MTVLLFFTPFKSHSIDVVKIKNQQLSKNKAAHNIEVIRRALEVTEAEYGAFRLEEIHLKITTNREVRVVAKGDILNVMITPANDLADHTITPINVPIRLGLLSYRLLLINKSDLPIFEKISTLEELKPIEVGLLNGWKTTGIFKSQNMNVVETHNYEGLFLMLNKHRFTYIPRAIYEVYDELSAQESKLNNIVIEPTIALYIPTATHVYVSPENPIIAKRLDAGLQKLLLSGELKKLLYKYFAADIKRANVSGRKIIKIDNNYYNKMDQSYNKYFLHAN